MSYVLNALRKTDNARSKKAGQKSTVAPRMPEQSEGKPRRRIGIIALLVPVLVGIYFGQEQLKQAVNLVVEQTQTTLAAPLATTSCVAEIPLAVISSTSPPPTHSPEQIATETYRTQFNSQVIHVMDGCHIKVKDEQNRILLIQLAGITCPPPQLPIGKEAQQFTKQFVQGEIRVAVLQKQPSNTLLADIFDLEHTLLNRMLVRHGLADTTEDRFQPDKQTARAAQKCLWQNENSSHNMVSPLLAIQP